MAKSLRSRLNSNAEAFLRDVETYGDWHALDMWKDRLDGYHDYLGLRRFILDETHDENFGRNPKLTTYYTGGLRGALRELVAAFADHVIRDWREKEVLKGQLEAYQHNYHKEETDCANQLLSLAEVLREDKILAEVSR